MCKTKLLAAFLSLGWALGATTVVDFAVEPPEVLLSGGIVGGCERTPDGVAFDIVSPADAEFVFLWSDEADAVPEEDVCWRAYAGGAFVALGAGFEVPFSEFPEADAVEFFVPGATVDWTRLDKVECKEAASPRKSAQSAAGGVSASPTVAVRACAGGKAARRGAAASFRSGSGFGTFTYEVSIGSPYPEDFSLFGVSAPGGTVTATGLPTCSGSSPGHSNVISVVATGGRFTPERDGTCTVHCSSDDTGSITVGPASASSTLGNPGKGSARLFGGQTYPVSASFSSVGGPYFFNADMEFAPDPDPVPGAVSYNPYLVIADSVVRFSIKQGQEVLSSKSHNVSIGGVRNPTNSYVISCEPPPAGLAKTLDADGNASVYVDGAS
ncbi:MAG: hypothetical protein IKO43_00930, partial [Kiritimatiellae bacterium]|nr:hypothetical protein [Kiritimatiellia bacterium]